MEQLGQEDRITLRARVRTQEEGHARHDRSDVLPQPRGSNGRTAGAARLRGRVRPRRPGQRRHGRGRLRPRLAHPRTGGGLVGAAHRRQRAAPLRLERLLVRPLPPRPRRPRAVGAPLPNRPRHPLLTHLRARHQARPPQPQRGPGHRGRGTGPKGRLLPPPHRPLLPRRHLPVRPGRGPTATTAPAGSPCSTTTASTSSAPGSWTAASSTSPTTCGGTSTTTPSLPASGARPRCSSRA